MSDENESAAPVADVNLLVEILRGTLPDILWRAEWQTYRLRFGVPFSARSLANMTSLHVGPPQKYLGRRVYYTRDDFLNWLETR